MRFPLKIDFEVLKPFFRVLYMKFLTESEYGMIEGTQQGLKSLFRAPLTNMKTINSVVFYCGLKACNGKDHCVLP